MNITKQFLKQKYFKENLTQKQIAELCNCSQYYIQQQMSKFDIKSRNYSEACKLKLNISKEFLLKEYIKNNCSQQTIADKLNVSRITILNYLKRYNIKRRKQTIKNGHSHNYTGKYVKNHCPDCGELKCWDSPRCKSCGQIKRNKDYPNSHPMKGKKLSKSHRQKIGIASKREWKKNRKFRAEAIIKGLHKTPNKCEKKLNKFLNIYLNKEYKFVGDGKVIIDGFNPDFININGQKKIIELYGDYWHNLSGYKERDKRRIKSYKKYGYKTLIIWEHELKNNSKLIKKIKEFHNASI